MNLAVKEAPLLLESVSVAGTCLESVTGCSELGGQPSHSLFAIGDSDASRPCGATWTPRPLQRGVMSVQLSWKLLSLSLPGDEAPVSLALAPPSSKSSFRADVFSVCFCSPYPPPQDTEGTSS